MPNLEWIGKSAVINHHNEIPYRLLQCNEELSVGDSGSGNLLVQGDNLHALKALLPYYAGKVKCIYIDPPYNTGDEAWIYNDNVGAPEMRKWLNETVGRDADDLSRHDKWLCMLYPRITLLREFLTPDGVIFVSIDENEHAHLRLIMDEVFDRNNAIGTLVWKRRSSSAMRGTPISIDHEYILVYASDSSRATLHGLAKDESSYPYADGRGVYASTDLTVGMGRDARPGQFYPISNPRTGTVYQPNPERVWRFFPDTMRKVIEADLIIWPDEAGGSVERPRYKTYYDPHTQKPKPVSSWIETPGQNDRAISADEVEYEIAILTSSMNQEGGRLLQQMLGGRSFAYPKPLSLVRSLLRASTRDDDLVMDSFAGTGTTGHAAMALNSEDGSNRRFLLIEMEPEIALTVTRERLRLAISGYTYTPSKGKPTAVTGLGGGFRYCTLAEPLFDEKGQVRKDVQFADLARHVFFTETGEPLPEGADLTTPLIGVHNGTAYYLLFNGILGDRSVNGGNVLTSALLASLAPHDGPRVVFGEGCRLGTVRLRKAGVTFRQIPYEVKVS